MKSSVISLNADPVCSLIILESVEIGVLSAFALFKVPYRVHCMQKSVWTVDPHVILVKC